MLTTAKGTEARPEKEHLDMDTKQAAGTFGKKSGTRISRPPKPGDKQSEAARKDIMAATREGAPAAKTKKVARSSRATSKSEKFGL